jgi:hypothetical protein
MRRIAAIGIVLGVLAAGVWIATPHARRGGVLVTISKETTVFTEPLRKDGYVDYIAAFNQILGKDVTPENNAVALFWKAIGPAGVARKIRAEYFRMLGVEVPAEKGDYFVPLTDFVQRQGTAAGLDTIDAQFQTATERPWKKSEFPTLAAWLEANQTQLDLFVDASRRPRYFSPLVDDESGLMIKVLLPVANELRGASRALVARAMLELGDGHAEACWQDLLATHRWARFFRGQGCYLIEALVALTVDQMACKGDLAVCQSARLSAADALRMRDDLNRLAPLPNLIDIVDQFERCSLLSCLAEMARDGTVTADGKSAATNPIDSFLNGITTDAIDWNTPLRIMNSWIDRDIAALREPTPQEQQAAFDRIHEQLRLIADSRKSGAPSLISFHNDFSEFVGQQIAALLLPTVDKANVQAHAAEMRFELMKLSFSLAAFRADHGSYPPQLGELAPKYAAEIPQDVFAGGEFHYKPDGDGYLLYSVGPNGADDGGREAADRTSGDPADDIAVRVRWGAR